MSKPVVYIERNPEEPMWEHCHAAWQGFKWDGYEVRFFYPLGEPSGYSVGWETAYGIPVGPNVPVVGSVESTRNFLLGAFGQAPAPLNVPDELLPYAGRAIERTTLGEALRGDMPVFIKPADTCKLFTGGVVTHPVTAQLCFGDLPQETPVLRSPALDLVSEYRLFINRDREIASMRHYSGDPFVRPSKLWVNKMIDAYTQAPRCYSLDVGITATGKTVVVECNDMWALGTYGMDPVAYSRMLAQRWHEMITNLTK